MIYKNIKIMRNKKSGKYYLKSPVNGTQRIFNTLEIAKRYIDNCRVIDSHAKAMNR